MGQIKNIKLHIVTDIKMTNMLQNCLHRLHPHLATALRATITARTTTVTPHNNYNTPPQQHRHHTASYSTDSKGYPTTCPGANYFKEGDEVVLKHPSEYPDWLWTLPE